MAIAGCGGGSSETELERANAALADHPRDARAMERVMRVAYEGAGARQDTATGRYTGEARPFLDRAASVWPRYLDATGARPGVPFASLMVQVFGQGLGRPEDAATAARYSARANPTVSSYLQLVAWAARAGDRKEARAAGRKALELADPTQRDDVRTRVRALITEGG
jgi:hypothetical protein